MPELHKRTYGYIDKNEGEVPPHRSPGRNRRRSSGFWPAVLLFPFKLAWLLIRLPFRFVSLLWKSSPSLSAKNKEVLRHKLLGVVAGGVGICILFGVLFIAWVSKDLPNPDRLTDRQIAQSTKIYDRTGEHLLYEVISQDGGEKRTLIKLEEVPKDLINGLVATEDTLFYEHRGVRPLSILRAVAVGVFTDKRIAGTSTLTQQLVKNAILTNERSSIRKAREIILSIRLEQKYSKNQILQIYFNEIPYGSTNYGVESAAQSYFGKHVSDLTLAESATLAGFPKAPSKYLNDSEALKTRRNFVLARMEDEGYITKEQKEAAQAEPLELKPNITNIKAPHFVMYVKEQLVEQYGEQTIERGGLKVITSLDWDKQQAAEKAITDHAKVLEEAGGNNASLVAMDPRTGQILAMVGSKDFFDDTINGQFNVATLGKRQPGSSFKPIIYAAAFEKGYTPDTVLYDVLTDFDASENNEYMPRNYDLGERGPITMRYALQGSLNIPAVQTLYLVGPKKGVEFAERMGYTTLSNGNFGLSLVLGGGEVKLLEHVAAYSVFANNGIRQDTASILKVESPDGEILSEWKPKRGERVLDEKIVATMSNVLSDDVARATVFGVGGVLTLPGRPVAAKTGTTNDYIDAWTMGYTPSLASGVWAGNTDNSKMKQGYGGSRVAGQIWRTFMENTLKDTPVESFPTPPPNDADKPVLRGSVGGSITLSVNKLTGKIATSSTPPEYIETRTYTQAHNILHYINKDDPRGPAPENPTDDPQYTIWENAIQSWITRKKEKEPSWNISFEDPPSQYDDPASLELIPSITVFTPSNNAIFNSRSIDTDIQVSAPRGIARVIYSIDGYLIQTVNTHPFNLRHMAYDLQNGPHTLTIRAEDDLGNRAEKTIDFTLAVTN